MASVTTTGQEPQVHYEAPLLPHLTLKHDSPRVRRGGMLIDRPSPFKTDDFRLVARRIADVRRHLAICAETLKRYEAAAVAGAEQAADEPLGVSPVAVRTLAACLSELLKIEWRLDSREHCPDLCKMLDCPQRPVLRDALCHSIGVLEGTKNRFKSKELKALRERLQAFLTNSDQVQFTPEDVR